jgi:hypothetical protein
MLRRQKQQQPLQQTVILEKNGLVLMCFPGRTYQEKECNQAVALEAWHKKFASKPL